MKRKLLFLAVSLLLLVLALVFSFSSSSKAQGISPCVRECQQEAVAAVKACKGDVACLEAAYEAYLDCIAGCEP